MIGTTVTLAAQFPDPFQLQVLVVLNFPFLFVLNNQAPAIYFIQYHNLRLVFNLAVSLYFEVPRQLANSCTLVPTVFRWHGKMEFKFLFYFSFSHDIEKRIWTSYFVFRFRITLKNGSEFRFNFVFIFASLWKRIWILFLVFASLWKTDLNFVFRFCMASLLKNRSEFRLSFFHDLKNGLLHQSSHLKSPDTPSRLTGAFTFSASESKWIFLSPGSKWVMNSSRPQWYVLPTRYSLF